MMIRKWVFLLVLLPFISNAQKAHLIKVIKHKDQIVFADNTPGTWFVIYFSGDSLKTLTSETGKPVSGKNLKPQRVDSTKSIHYYPCYLFIDDRNIQVMKYPYSRKDYHNLMGVSEEKALLRSIVRYEKGHIEENYVNTSIDVKETFYKNKHGKNFLIWYYKKPDSNKSNLHYQLYLSFVSNYYIGTVNLAVQENQKLENEIKYVKRLMDRIVVYGSNISLAGIYHYLEAQINGHPNMMESSSKGIRLEIPAWLNFCSTRSPNIWLFNFPDSANIQNAVYFFFFPKSKYNSLVEFNEFVLNRKSVVSYSTDSRNLIKDGLSAKILNNRGGYVYHTHAHTIENNKGYLWINFVATKSTYDYNIGKYFSFLKDLEIY